MYVVIFTITNEVKCIPCNWFISHSQAYWSNLGSCDVARVIKTKANPDPKT